MTEQGAMTGLGAVTEQGAMSWLRGDDKYDDRTGSDDWAGEGGDDRAGGRCHGWEVITRTMTEQGGDDRAGGR